MTYAKGTLLRRGYYVLEILGDPDTYRNADSRPDHIVYPVKSTHLSGGVEHYEVYSEAELDADGFKPIRPAGYYRFKQSAYAPAQHYDIDPGPDYDLVDLTVREVEGF